MRRLVPIALVFAACGTDFTEHPEVVDRLRVLGIVTEPPETTPGATVTLSGLVADPFGPRDPYRGWFLCPTIGTSEIEGDPQACADRAQRVSLGEGDTITWQIPDDFEIPPGEVIDLFIALEVAVGAERDIASKKIRLSASATPNANPSLDAVLLDGTPLVAPRAVTWNDVHSIAIEASGDAEDFLEAEVFVSAGTFDELGNRGAAPFTTSWFLEGERPTGGTIWALVRDGRGGTAFAAREVTFQ